MPESFQNLIKTISDKADIRTKNINTDKREYLKQSSIYQEVILTLNAYLPNRLQKDFKIYEANTERTKMQKKNIQLQLPISIFFRVLMKQVERNRKFQKI